MKANIPDDLDGLAVELDSLRLFPDNAREGDIGAICTSLQANGQYRPVVVNRREGGAYGDMTILAGNHTVQAARALGWERIAATFVDVDDDTARRIVLVDNRSNDLASYDDAGLADLLASIMQDHGPSGLEGTGFDSDDLDALLADLADPSFDPVDPDEQPRLDQRDPQECPSCGFEWRVGPQGSVEPV